MTERYSLLKAAAPTSEELLRKLTAEILELHHSGAAMRLDIDPATAFGVVSMCQVALRHPALDISGPSGELVRGFIELVRSKFEPHAPAIALAIERGNDPRHDTRPEAPPRDLHVKQDEDGFLSCPYCGFTTPALFERVECYICPNCGRPVAVYPHGTA